MRRTPANLILDNGTGTVTTLAHSVAGGTFCNGIMWPMLPRQRVRILNTSCEAFTDAPGVIDVNAMSIILNLFDGSQNELPYALLLAAATYPTGTKINGTFCGAVLENDNNPLLDLWSSFLVPTGPGSTNSEGPPAFFQIFANIDATNTDGANSHTVQIEQVTMLEFHTEE